MRRLGAALLGGVILSLIAAAAYAQGQTRGVYIGIEGGWTDLLDMTGKDIPASITSFALVPSQGYGVGGKIGYGFGRVSLESELVYRHNDLQTVNLTGKNNLASTQLSGGVESLAVMGNVIVDILPHSRWTPYIGAGIGGARVTANTTIPALGGFVLTRGDNYEFAYQGVAGLKFAITPNVSASLDYRYFATTNPKFHDQLGASVSTNYDTHNVFLTLAYHFWTSPPPPPPAPVPVAAPPPPLPPPPPAQQVFLVFFDFDKFTLTPAAAQVVQQAADYYKSTGSPRLIVTGYTDLSGTQQYNLGLSQRRAETVSAALIRAGVRSDAITATWRGKENPRVPTPDGAREPQNRRVEIVI